VKVEIETDLEAVGAAAWEALTAAAARPSPFLTWTWQQEWARVFAAGRRVEVRRVLDGEGRLQALLPLYEAAPERWCLVGGADISDYLDLVAAAGREEDAWAALLASRAVSPAAWELHAVPAASTTVTALPRLAAAAGLAATVEVEERCPVLDLPPTWDAYLARLTGKHRHEITRKMRRLERERPDARVVAATTPADVTARLPDFLALHRRSRAGKARFMDEPMATFFGRVLPALAARDGARLWFLDGAAGPLAAYVTLEWDGTVGLYNSGFAPEQAALSPGVVLLAHLVRDAIARGRRRFDFLRGEERYKYEFEPAPEDVHRVTIQRRPPDGRAGAPRA
jgi:CelD/BcsL family acetyltransferase involved in cellulose biosynthesis